MTHQVKILRRAEQDVRWIAQRSRPGAATWLNAYEELLVRLSGDAESFGPAEEADDLGEDLRQALFKTRRGRTYRAVFVIVGGEVRILRVRGPGQSAVGCEEL